MEPVAALEQQEADQAIQVANQLVREQLAQLRAQQERLSALLRARETDLEHLLILVDDLTYRASASGAAGLPPRWLSRLESLRKKEEELRGIVQQMNAAKGRLDSLISAVSSITNLGKGQHGGATGNPMEAAIAGRTLQGQEAERSRLAREVHDGPAQVLANAIMGLEYCERLVEKRPEAVPGELQRLKSGMSDGLEEVRRFIFDLRPTSLEYDGLCATLERYAANFQNRFGVAVTVRCEEVDGVLSSEERFVAFRVIQEAMQNARKHAAASRMEIAVQRAGDDVLVSASDNGRGFEMDQNKVRGGHYGLQGMRERAESVQGSVVVFSEPGYGTEVRLRIALKADAATGTGR